MDNDDEDVDFNVTAAFRRLAMVDEDDEEAQERCEADEVDDDINMNVVCDEIAHAYYMAQRRRWEGCYLYTMWELCSAGISCIWL